MSSTHSVGVGGSDAGSGPDYDKEIANRSTGGRMSQSNMDQTEYNLLEVVQRQGTSCPICHLVNKGVNNYLDSISYESVNDPDIRRELRDALGYCAVHGQEWLRLQDTLGTAIIWRDVLGRVLEVLRARVAPPAGPNSGENVEEGGGTGASPDEGLAEKFQRFFGNQQTGRAGSETGSALAAELEPSAPCPVCEYSLKREKDFTAAFAKGLGYSSFREAYERHEMGLCLPHFRMVLRHPMPAGLVQLLVRAQEEKLGRTIAELDEVVRKHDYRYRDEPRGDEFKVPARSVIQGSGSLPTQLNLPGRHPRHPAR